ncbi:hypothetical protein AAZX31_19G022400 [Glycine max]|nr:hypothetical protein JHK87_052161 [Glycine soja]
MSILLLSLFASGVKKYFVHASITFFSLFCTFFTSFWLTFVVCFSRSSLLRCLVWFGLVWRSKSNTFAPMLFYVYVVHGYVTFFGLFFEIVFAALFGLVWRSKGNTFALMLLYVYAFLCGSYFHVCCQGFLFGA